MEAHEGNLSTCVHRSAFDPTGVTTEVIYSVQNCVNAVGVLVGKGCKRLVIVRSECLS